MTNGKVVRINATLSDEILALVDAYANALHEDRSTAVRQLVMKGLTFENMRRAVDAYKHGKLTLREINHLLKIDYWEAQDLLLREGIPVSSLTERELDMRLAKKAKF
jgi:hypothetical protein